MATKKSSEDPRFKSALRERAAFLYSQGKTVQEIGEVLGVTPGRAYILALEGGATMRKRGPAK